MPEGSLTQMMRYFRQDGTTMAKVHQYVLPGGAIRPDSRPDPKSVLFEGEIYAVPIEPPPECRQGRRRRRRRRRRR